MKSNQYISKYSNQFKSIADYSRGSADKFLSKRRVNRKVRHVFNSFAELSQNRAEYSQDGGHESNPFRR